MIINYVVLLASYYVYCNDAIYYDSQKVLVGKHKNFCESIFNNSGDETAKSTFLHECEKIYETKCMPKYNSVGSSIQTSISVRNSSLELRWLNLEPIYERYVCKVNGSSFLAIRSSRLYSSNTLIGISSLPSTSINGIYISLLNLSVNPISSNGCVGALVETNKTQLQNFHQKSIFNSQHYSFHESFQVSISVRCCKFCSFVVASSPFVGCKSSVHIRLQLSSFANISSYHSLQASSSLTSFYYETACFMSCCSFSSVCDVYDGGIVPSLNNPLASLTASNTSFIECCRTRNAEFIGTEENKLTPERQNETENGQNIFIWCEWHESKTTGTNNSVSDGASNGGAIFLCNLPSGSLTVSHCSFIDCSAYYAGGGIMCRLVDSLNIENNSFNACTAQNNGGGCTYANNIASCFRISGCEIQKCSAKNYGGGLCIEYINDLESGCIEAEKGEGGEACLFDCYITSCKLSGTCGGGNLLYESFTTNNNDKRLCYAYYSNGLVHQHTEKKEWLNEGMKDRTVGVNGNDSNEMCGASKFIPCLTVGHAVDACTDKLISKITVLGGRHGSEGATISVSEKKIIIVGKGSEVSVIWTRSLSPSSTTLFSVTSGQLDVQHLGIDHNVMRSPSPSVFVMSLGSGSLSLEDVLISSPASAGRNVISASVLIIPFSQLRLSAVVIKNMILTEPIFSEPLSAESVSGDKVLSNITIRNVNRTTGDGVVVEKNVKKGETFVVCNATIEGCESLKGDGGGLFLLVELQGGIKMEMVTFTECKVQQGRSEEEEKRIGGGIFVELSDQIGSFVLEGMIFEGCNAWKGKNMFVSGWDLSEIVNKEHFKWEMSSEELGSLDELCGWERKTTGEKGYVIPLVVYLWSNWSGNGFVSKENGRDFSGCGYSEIPCSSINYLISLRFATLSENKALIMITDPVSLCYSESFLSSSYNTPVVSIEGKEKGTKVIISDDDENDLNDSMISSNVILSFGNISFTIPDSFFHHSSFIQSFSSAAKLSLFNCIFISSNPLDETKYCIIDVIDGSVMLCDCSIEKFVFSKPFMKFSSSVQCLDLEGFRISDCEVSASSIITLSKNSLKQGVDTELLGASESTNAIIVNGSSFTNISRIDKGETLLSVDSSSVCSDCEIEDCLMVQCQSTKSEEGGGMKICIKGKDNFVKVSGCVFVMCECSAANGRGGAIMIDACMPTDEMIDIVESLGFMMKNIKFSLNDAFVGRDIFVKCNSIEKQIKETQFLLDFGQDSLLTNNSICASDMVKKEDIDLIPIISFYYATQIFVRINGSDIRQCGSLYIPCKSISHAALHIQKGELSTVLVDEEGEMREECVIEDSRLVPRKLNKVIIHINAGIEARSERSIITFVNECAVERCRFCFGSLFEFGGECFVTEKYGLLAISECSFECSDATVLLNCTLILVESGELKMNNCSVMMLKTSQVILHLFEKSKGIISETNLEKIESESDVAIVMYKANIEMKDIQMRNISISKERSIAEVSECEKQISIFNCSFNNCSSKKEIGFIMSAINCLNLNVISCEFSGVNEDEGGKADKNENIRNRICKWNGSMVDLKMSRAEMTDTTLKNGINGGLSISGGSAKISAGNFSNNNPAIDGYGSVRRNVICTDLAELNVISLKGGDGILPGSSLWMISEECVLKGIASERVFPFFIPVLESVETREKGEEVEIAFKGKLLLPCNLSFMVVKQMGEEKQIEKHNFKESGYVSETAAKGILPRETITEAGEEVEVSVCILFGNADHPSSTDYLILKNKSEAEPKGDERIFEGEDKIEWSLFAFFGCIVIVVILLFVIVLMVVLLRKKLREPEKKIEKEKLENEQIMENVERRSETNEESFEMIELPSTLLEGMTNQIPLLIDEEENQPEQLETPTMNDEILNENDLPDLEYPMPFSENDSFSGELQLHSFKVISAKKPFREKEKTNIKTLHSTIHSLQGDFTFGTRAMSVIDGKEVVKSVAKLFQHLISVGDERVEIMAKQLCPYTIFASEGNYEIYVLAEELKDKKQKDEMKRWQAPELNSENEEEEEEEEGEGIEKAVVFTLGLILHETTTGEVPLSQCDAEEAQEMMRDGVRPITEGIEEEDLIDLIEEMWEAEPKERPLLSEVINILIEIKENHS